MTDQRREQRPIHKDLHTCTTYTLQKWQEDMKDRYSWLN